MNLISHISHKKGHGCRLWPFFVFLLCLSCGGAGSAGDSSEASVSVDSSMLQTLADSAQVDSFSQALLLTEPVEWKIVVCGMLKARKIKDLKGLTVAISRFDGSDRVCDSIVAAAGLDPADVYHPQIDSLLIRCQMLDHNQIDAALLPLPLAEKAKVAGHRIIEP